MDTMRSWTNSLALAITTRLALARLTRGQKRLRRFKSLLSRLLLASRDYLTEGPHPPENPVLSLLRLPQELFLGDKTMAWMLELLEDLDFLTQALLDQMEMEISRRSQPR